MQMNVSENSYVGNSHLILPDGVCLTLCSHTPCCLSGRLIASWDDPIVLRGPKIDEQAKIVYLIKPLI